MIKIDRSNVRKPRILSGKQAALVIEELNEFFSVIRSRRKQQRYKIDHSLYDNDEIRKHLFELFHGKCAYCESPLDPPDAAVVDHFRPETEAHGIDGESTPDWYWWLIYEWDNLYLSCYECSYNKGIQFGVVGSRAAKLSYGDELYKERSLLIDPCRDEPRNHLFFDLDGIVRSGSKLRKEEHARYQEVDRGAYTIEVLGLNRPNLVEARKHTANMLIKLVEDIVAGNREYDDQAVSFIFSETQPFSELRFQVFNEWLADNAIEWDEAIRGREELQFEYISQVDWEMIEREGPDAVELAETLPTEFSETMGDGYIARVEIHNFRLIEDMSLDFVNEDPDKVPWLMLLGENGTGKSSILKAIALALIGGDIARELGSLLQVFEPDELLRYGARKGHVEVYLSNAATPNRVDITRTSIEFNNDGPAKISLRGYGATRLLPARHMSELPSVTERVRVTNLFNPHAPLINAESWLVGLPRPEFDTVALSLKDLLNLDDTAKIRKSKSQVVVEEGRNRDTLYNLSDGYQSVIALAVDIIAGLGWQGVRDFRNATGVVLVDEIGAHLHPRWKMAIIENLRKTFPRVQFVTTTHNPLCLQGTVNGEVYVLVRDRVDSRIQESQVNVRPGASVEELLTGEWFGLPSTRDPETQALLEEHRVLLSERKTKKNLAKREEIEAKLRVRLGGYAETGIERIAHSVASEIIDSDIRKLGPKERKDLRNKILAATKARREG